MKWKPPQEWSGTTAFSKELYLPPAQNPLCLTEATCLKALGALPLTGDVRCSTSRGNVYNRAEVFTMCWQSQNYSYCVPFHSLCLPNLSLSQIWQLYKMRSALGLPICTVPSQHPRLLKPLGIYPNNRNSIPIETVQEPSILFGYSGNPSYRVLLSASNQPLSISHKCHEHF